MSFHSKLVGSWELVSYTATNIDDINDVQYPMTENAKGMIMYSSDGYMSAHLSRPDLSSYRGGPFSGTAEELSKVASSTIAYMGPYYLEEKYDSGKGETVYQLFHEVKVSIPPNWIASVQERSAKMEEGSDERVLLHLTGNTVASGGVTRFPKITWRKLRDNTSAKL